MLLPGADGEILVRGPNVMQGYWNAPAATATALRGGWYHSGDIGHFDDEGYLHVVARKNDLIISGGENIYPAEIENVLLEHPAIVEACVVGCPDERWGEAVVAVGGAQAGRTPERGRCDGAAGRPHRPLQAAARECVSWTACREPHSAKCNASELRAVVAA